MIKIKFIKDTEKAKAGEVGEASKKSAESYVTNGYAEYFDEEPKQSVKTSEEAVEVIRKRIEGDKPKKEITRTEAKKIAGEISKDLGIEEEPINEEEIENFIDINYNKKTGIEISRNVNIDKVAEYLVSKYNFKTIYGEKNEKIKVYDGKIFVSGARGIIKGECEKFLKSYAKKNVVEEIFDKIKRKTKTNQEEFDKTDLYLIPLLNGVYNIKKKKLEEHSPKNNFTFLSPVEYNQEAKCPNWFKFIDESLYPEDKKVMKQW